MPRKSTITISTMNGNRSPSPEYYIDLTVDSPSNVCTSTRHRPVSNRTTRSRKPQNTSSQAADPHNPDGNRLPQPNKRRCKDNDIELDAIIDLSETIPPNDVARINDSVTGETNVLSCPICFELLCSTRKPTSTRCGHIFCAECIEQTFIRSKKCPKCQLKITPKSCIRLYL